MKKYLITALVGLLSVFGVMHHSIAQEQGTGSGQVRGMDPDKGRVAIKHGPISDLKLPAMTLVYTIDPSLLVGINAGDEVKFTAKHEAKQYIIIKIKK